MLFSSLLFLYAFLPVVLLLALLCPRHWHNTILLLASLIFYAWGGVSYTVILLISILINYFTGLGIARRQNMKARRLFLAAGITLNLLILLLFKYADFIVDNLNLLLTFFQLSAIQLEPIDLPLGISFFTFQAISYIVDVYQHRTPVQKKLRHLGLYIALFPQLIAGPIVRYHDIADQIRQRSLSFFKLSSGIERFIFGLAKKVFLANNFAQVADDIFAVSPANLDPATAWVGLICYTLQIYFDFAGYTDMAIGLGRMFGFDIPENFNFPYVARSVREFWRRWHISLSQWFRDYLYIPLGGNRRSAGRTYFNLITVFFLTGLWHGASWNFVIWGLFHGFFMVIERIGFDRTLKRIWAPLAHAYTLLVVTIGWVFFRLETMDQGWGYCLALFGRKPSTGFHFDLSYYFDYQFIIALAIGLLAATPVFRRCYEYLGRRSEKTPWRYPFQILSSFLVIFLFLYCSMLLANNVYNPFIYFRF